MKNVWVGTDWHVWSAGHTPHHPYQSVSNIRQLSDSYANDIQVDDVFIYLGDLCDPAVTDLNELKRLVQNIPGYKILVKGNHDTETDYFYRDIGFDEVCDICVINQVAFSHFPLKVEPDMINIHGHLHSEKRSDVNDANHINAYREDYYKHPIEISELIQDAYNTYLKDRVVHTAVELSDAKTGKVYDASRVLYLTDIFEEDMLKPVDESVVGEDEVSTTYLMSLSTVDTEEKLLRWIKQNLHIGPMGKVKTDIEMARSRSASDFDIALFVNPRLRKLGHNPRLMIFVAYEPTNPKPGFVHMFNYWVDLDDSATWFEASWRKNVGIHEFKDVNDMKTEILNLYRDQIESNKYTETIFHSVNPAYLKPGRDPQDILKDIFGEDGLVNESFAINGLPHSCIKVDDQDYGDDGLVSCIDWFCDNVQLGNQLIHIKTTDRIRNLWAITEQDSSPLGGRGVDDSYVIRLDMVPENIDKFSLMKFVCIFDIMVTTSNQRTIETGCPNALCAAIAYWYSQPYYDQLFEFPEEYMHPSKEVQKWFNMFQCYQRTINDTAVDLLVRDLFWNKEVDPKILISSALKNSMIACDVNNESAMNQYENLLSLNEGKFSDKKSDDLNEILMEPEDAHLFLADDDVGEKSQKPYKVKLSTDDQDVMAESVYNFDQYIKDANITDQKKIDRIIKSLGLDEDHKYTSLVDDILDANIVINPENVDKVLLGRIKNSEELAKYFTDRLSSFADPVSDDYLGSAVILEYLVNNLSKANYMKDFVPEGLSENEFAEYMSKRFNELQTIEVFFRMELIEHLKNIKVSEAEIKNILDNPDMAPEQIKKIKKMMKDYTISEENGTVKYTYDSIPGVVYIQSNVYHSAGNIISPDRLFGRATRYDMIIIVHRSRYSTKDNWECEPITINGKTYTSVNLIAEKYGKYNKLLLLICNTDGSIIPAYDNVTYSATTTIMESANPKSKMNGSSMIRDKLTIMNSRQKMLKKLSRRINTYFDQKNYIVYPVREYPGLYLHDNQVDSSLVHFDKKKDYIKYVYEFNNIIDRYLFFLESCKTIFMIMDKIYHNTMNETGYCWTCDQQSKIPTISYTPSNPFIYGVVYNTLDECIGSISNYYKYDSCCGTINVYQVNQGFQIIPLDKPINEDAYQLQGIDRDQQDVISKKYGIRAVGHETEEEIKYREEREKAERERKEQFKKKQKDRQLAKARKAKKKYAKKREQERRREEFKSKFNKKNEEVDISDIPYNDGSRNFFDNTPGISNGDFVNETGYKFEMLDKVKFFDPINESTDDRTLYPVYVLCVHTGTLLANAIKKATGSHFSHCTISFDSSLKNMYSFGRKTKLTELSNGSFVKESIHNSPYTNEDVTYALYCIPVTASQLAAMKKRLEYFVKNKTKFRYDFAGLFKNFFGIADNPEQRWFCSRFVADIINAGTEPGQKPMIREPSLTRPEDFLYTNFALYVTSGLIKEYDQILVDKVTKKLLRIESIRRAQQRAVQSTNIPVTESAVLDLNPYDPLGEAIFNYQMATMDESAYQNFKKYLHSFKIKLDKDGNIIIHRREVDQLDKYFREANQLLKVNMKAGNKQGVIDQLCRIHYMIKLINKYYLISTTKQNTTVKADLKKQLIDLRSVMINVYQQYLSWVTARDPQFNFQTAYDASIYSDKITVPKEVLTSIGRVIMTLL